MPTLEPADLIGAYVDKVRVQVQSAEKPLTVSEIRSALGLSDRVVRMCLDRLLFLHEVTVTKRFEPNRRGAIPLQYQAAQPS